MSRYNADDGFLYSTDEVLFNEIQPEPGRYVSRGRDSTKLTIKVDRSTIVAGHDVDHRTLKRTINVRRDDHKRRKDEILIHNYDQRSKRKDRERRKEEQERSEKDISIQNHNAKSRETGQRAGKTKKTLSHCEIKSLEACKRVQLQIQESYKDDAEESIVEQGSKFVSRAEFHCESDLRLEIDSIKQEKEKMRNDILNALNLDEPSKDILQKYRKPKRGGEIIEHPEYQDSIKADLLNKKISSILSKDVIQAKVQDILQDLTNTEHAENFSRTFDEVLVQGYVDPEGHQFPQSFNHYQKTKQLEEEQQMPSDQAYYRQDLPQPNCQPAVQQPFYGYHEPPTQLQTVSVTHPLALEETPYYEQYQLPTHCVPHTQPYPHETPQSSFRTQTYPNFGPYDTSQPPAYKQTQQTIPYQHDQLQQMAQPHYESYYPPSAAQDTSQTVPNPQQQRSYLSYNPPHPQHNNPPAPCPTLQHADPYHSRYPTQITRSVAAASSAPPPSVHTSTEFFNSYKGIPFNRIQDNVEGKPLVYNPPPAVAQTKPLSAENSKYGFFCHKCRLGYNSSEAWRVHICCDLHKILTGVWFVYKPFTWELKHGVKIYCICCQKKMEFTTKLSYKQHMAGKLHKKGEMTWLGMGRPLPTHPYVRVNDLNKNIEFSLG